MGTRSIGKYVTDRFSLTHRLFSSRVGDRAKGAVGGVVAGLMGDEEGEERYKTMHDGGKMLQRSAAADIDKEGGKQ